MAGVTADIVLSIQAALAGANVAGAAPRYGKSIEKRVQIEAGTGAVGKADLLYSATRTIAASGNDPLDLAGVLVGPLGGAAIAAAEVVAIYIEAAAANTNDVLMGGGATPFVGPIGAAGILALKPGEFALFTSTQGWPVTPATADLLRIANSGAGTGVDYTIIVIARSVVNP